MKHNLRVQFLVGAVALAAACATPSSSAPTRAPAPIVWESWSSEVFERAQREHKLVLLDLEAVWCHWCHVMAETTYADPKIVAQLDEHFICVRVDQDARPDLSHRYEDFGWPATILFDAQGGELVKRAGYIPPEPMRSLLAAVVADPTPGPSVEKSGAPLVVELAKSAALADDLRAQLVDAIETSYDAEHGAWGFSHKYLDPTNTEYELALALDGDENAKKKARQTFDAQLALLDPVWGGMYQYSTGGVWTEPHFEKIASIQAEDLRLYSLAYAAWKSPKHLEAARAIRKFLATFLTSEGGAFYTSQDADLVQGEHSADYFALDDAARRARGIPRVDQHIYSRENGWFVRALCQFGASTGDESAIAAAAKAAQWIVEHRSVDGAGEHGGFRHDEVEVAGPYLGDTLAMGQAFAALYEVTSERTWLDRALAASNFVDARFASDAGAATIARSANDSSWLAAQPPQRDENLDLIRFENSLARTTGDEVHRRRAERAMRWLASRDIASKFPTAAALLADRELAGEPLHVTIVGAKSDAAARALYKAALAKPATFRRIEWWDPTAEKLVNPDVDYPPLDKPAAFVCADGRCSPPAFSAFELEQRLAKKR